MDITVLTAFSIAVFLLALTPGPDIVYVAMRGVSQGKMAGVTAAAGLITGVFFHIFIAVAGVSAILTASPVLFGLLKYAGAGYIFYLGWNIARSGPLNLENEGGKYRLWQIYRQTIVMNILNPKVALFFLAFLPQFVDQGGQNPLLQLVILGLIFQLVSFAVMASVGFFPALSPNAFMKPPPFHGTSTGSPD